MTFAEKLKSLRRRAGMSQEQLAERLNVSRQAVTKWETGAGIPDIENMIAVSALFRISLDELLMQGDARKGNIYESTTEYDVDGAKRFDIRLGGARSVTVRAYEGEKLLVRLSSDTLPSLARDVKVKIDDVKNAIDIDVRRMNGIAEETLKRELCIFVDLPADYLSAVEISAHAERVALSGLRCERIELDVKTADVTLDHVSGRVEIDCNLDMRIDCRTLEGYVEINQISATSRICVPANAQFSVRKRGIANQIYYEKEGARTACPADGSSENVIALNGIKSELIICTSP